MCFKERSKTKKRRSELTHYEEVVSDRNRVPRTNRNLGGGNTSFRGYDGPKGR